MVRESTLAALLKLLHLIFDPINVSITSSRPFKEEDFRGLCDSVIMKYANQRSGPLMFGYFLAVDHDTDYDFDCFVIRCVYTRC